jgi:hypothetical protein
MFGVHVSAPYSKILWTKAWYMSFFGFVNIPEEIFSFLNLVVGQNT